jgi:hypothetical protein
VYVDPVQKRVRWKLFTVGSAKKAQQWMEGNETGAEKIGKNCKKTQKTQKQTEK